MRRRRGCEEGNGEKRRRRGEKGRREGEERRGEGEEWMCVVSVCMRVYMHA